MVSSCRVVVRPTRQQYLVSTNGTMRTLMAVVTDLVGTSLHKVRRVALCVLAHHCHHQCLPASSFHTVARSPYCFLFFAHRYIDTSFYYIYYYCSLIAGTAGIIICLKRGSINCRMWALATLSSSILFLTIGSSICTVTAFQTNSVRSVEICCRR